MKPAVKYRRHRRIYLAAWKPVRAKALERDEHACVRCGDTNRLAVHHIDPDGPDYDLANLETLCGTCHAIEHKPWRVLAEKTHCKHNHEFTPENTVWQKTSRGKRARCCRICKQEAMRRFYRRKIEATGGVI